MSVIVVYPDAKRAEGERFLRYVEQRRRFHFDNYFKRIEHSPTGSPPESNAPKNGRGFVVFSRDWMSDVYDNDRPESSECVECLAGSAFAGEYEPLTFSIVPHEDLGKVAVSLSDLRGPGAASIPAAAVDVGYVQ